MHEPTTICEKRTSDMPAWTLSGSYRGQDRASPESRNESAQNSGESLLRARADSYPFLINFVKENGVWKIVDY